MNFLLDLFLPKFCFGCQKPGSYLCSRCYKTINFTNVTLCPVCEKPSPFGYTHFRCQTKFGLDGMYVLADYSGTLRHMIHYLKYRHVFSLDEILVKMLLDHYPSQMPEFDLLTSIPLHPKRYRERGYNQAEIIARLFGQKKHLAFSGRLLVRNRQTLPQMSIKNFKTRRKNIVGAFSYANKIPIGGKNIAIVDDVATTGATISEAAKVLKQNGAEKVWGIVLAR